MVLHEVDDAEVALCERSSADAADLMHGVSLRMGTEADNPFPAFFVAASLGASGSSSLDEGSIRDFFGGTLFPAARIIVEPFAESTTWWGEAEEDGAECGSSYFVPWRALISWFRSQPAFRYTAFVGSARELGRLPSEANPPGTVMPGCNLPRLAVGLTHRGSLTGLFGYVVQL